MPPPKLRPPLDQRSCPEGSHHPRGSIGELGEANATATPIPAAEALQLRAVRHCAPVQEALSVMYITNLSYFLRIGPRKVKCDALANKSIALAGCLD
jgi:hypothetical protein